MQIPTTMQAAVLFGFNDVRLTERPVPDPGSDEVLIKVEACGVCAGDIKMITHSFPLNKINEAIDTFVERKKGAIKVVVQL